MNLKANLKFILFPIIVVVLIVAIFVYIFTVKGPKTPATPQLVQEAVSYTHLPQGSKPGMVIYVNYKTIFVDPTKK